MLSFLARHPRPPRTKTAHLSTISLDDGLSTVTFHPPGGRFLVTNHLPPAAAAAPRTAAVAGASTARSSSAASPSSSVLAPPPHRHLWQDETFRVVRGTARFTFGTAGGGGGGGRQGGGQGFATRAALGPRPDLTLTSSSRLATAGEEVVVPRRAPHTFCNASAEEPLVVEFVLAPASGRTDEAYFRNVWGYRDDCRRAGVQRNLFQNLLFMHRGGVVMALPGPEMVSIAAGWLLNLVGGVLVGKWLLGFRDSYPEYYHEASS